MPSDVGPSGLPLTVEARIRTEVPDDGGRILAALTTATWLLAAAAQHDDPTLRLAESATYNLREAIDGVAKGRTAAEGGLRPIHDAWTTLELTTPGTAEEAEARAALDDVLRRVMDDRERSSQRSRQILAYLRKQAGAEPLGGQLDPVVQYAKLLGALNDGTHDSCTAASALDLLDRTRNWFIRMFTAPDEQVRAVIDLAISPYTGLDQLTQLVNTLASPHHLRLFFGRLLDPAWLDALTEAALIPLPAEDGLWPVAAVTDGLARSHPGEVAGLLRRLLARTGTLVPAHRAVADFEILRVASYLGPQGHGVVAEVLRHHGQNHAVQTLGTQVALEADPQASIVVSAARAVIGDGKRVDDRWVLPDVLDRLGTGLTLDNRKERVQFLAGKLRALLAEPSAFYAGGVASLRVGVAMEHDIVVVLAHHLVRLIARCRELLTPTADLQKWVGTLSGNIGERITCQLLADAVDVPVEDKIAHMTRRLQHATATGDDRDLVAAILDSGPGREQLAMWRSGLGTPSVRSAEQHTENRYPDDWVRIWRWTAVIPPWVYDQWQDAVHQINATYGPPAATDFDRRQPAATGGFVQSPYSVAELSDSPPAEVAKRVAAWRPDPVASFFVGGAYELAGAIEELVNADPAAWTVDPLGIITALREPLYIQYYLRALTNQAAQLGNRAPEILRALHQARTTRATPTEQGLDGGHDDEAAWTDVDTAVVQLIKAIAATDGELGDQADQAWRDVLTAARARPDSVDDLRHILGDRDALHSAANRPWSIGLDAAVALARWEARRTETVRPAFTILLDEVLTVTDSAGLEYRAILAHRRRVLENILPTWLDDRADLLFRDGVHGQATFELTLRWGQTSPWLLDRFTDETYAATLHGADDALSHLLVAALRGHTGYSITNLLSQLRANHDVLRAAAEDVARLLQQVDPDSPLLSVGVEFWKALLEATARRSVPAPVLEGTGRWAFVASLDDEQWLTLTHRTLELSAGRNDYPVPISRRIGASGPSETSLRVLTLLLETGDLWEQSYVRDRAADLLRRTPDRTTHAFRRLRTRLIELGRHEVLDLTDDADGDPSAT